MGANPLPRRVGKGGCKVHNFLPVELVGASQSSFKRGKLPTLAMGPRDGNGGWRGKAPIPGELGGVPPGFQKGANRQHWQTAPEWD